MKKSKKYVQSFSFAEKSLLMATVLMRLLPLQKNLVLPFKELLMILQHNVTTAINNDWVLF
jgi:hypothetical protein